MAGMLLLGMAVAAYKIRCRQRIAYGFAELLFGFFAFIWGVHSIDLFQVAQGNGYGRDLVAAKMIAGLFIITRGLNNLDESVKQNQEISGSLFGRILVTIVRFIT